jgi:phospholipase C
MPALPDSLDSRREFLRKVSLLATGGALGGALAASIQRALAIEPAAGSSYLDAEHVVILMQENRSFDHMFGTLRGVRGYNDPRAVDLPNGNPVWLQSNGLGETYAPFRLNLLDSKATWMGDLPHGRKDQGEARNHGRHDGWLVAKALTDKAYAGVPLTLGYYTRDDIPFYYGLADAFTVCDQAFCSVIGPTTPNRLHLWTGTVRPDKTQGSRAHVQNEDTDFGAEVAWKTFPERLEDLGISWKNYQNELAVPSGLEGDFDAWLSNFGDNPLEFFTQYGVYFAGPHRRHLAETEGRLARELAALEASRTPLSGEEMIRKGEALAELSKVREAILRWSDENFFRLTPRERSLHEKGLVTNSARADYRELSTLRYSDGGQAREMVVPKGDVLHQFREDVRRGELPAVSWLIPPERFSEHPSNPWYGALYLSETLDILTQNPEVWRKTIFILCYDENDGYFDHVPPFVPPRADRPDTGRVSAGIDTSCEHVLEDRSKAQSDDGPGKDGRDGPIGLGFRVPLVVASPWSRGGYVCSQVFDHTSVLRFLENFASARAGTAVRETNISDWRRTVCGDLSSAFRPFQPGLAHLPEPLRRDVFLAAINQAQYRPIPSDFRSLTAEEVGRARQGTGRGLWPRQEAGTRPSCPLPYELGADGVLDEARRSFSVVFSAGSALFGDKSAGAPFHVYAGAPVRQESAAFEAGRTWSYAVRPGDRVVDEWRLEDFEGGAYFLRVHGPNGFFRELRGGAGDPRLSIGLRAAVANGVVTGDGVLELRNADPGRPAAILVEELRYGGPRHMVELSASGGASPNSELDLAFSRSSGWHELRITVTGYPGFSRVYAGRIETGRESVCDPQIAATT